MSDRDEINLNECVDMIFYSLLKHLSYIPNETMRKHIHDDVLDILCHLTKEITTKVANRIMKEDKEVLQALAKGEKDE